MISWLPSFFCTKSEPGYGKSCLRPLLYNRTAFELIRITQGKAIHVKSIKPDKPAPKVKATRKSAATGTAKTAAAEVVAPVVVKQAHGTSRPVMSLPPPTGQPPKPAGKNARIPDTAAPRHATLVKRDTVKA